MEGACVRLPGGERLEARPCLAFNVWPVVVIGGDTVLALSGDLLLLSILGEISDSATRLTSMGRLSGGETRELLEGELFACGDVPSGL